MKKIILTLLAAIAALSVDAQIIEVYRGTSTTPEAIYDSNYNVKFKAKKVFTADGYSEPTSTEPGKCNKTVGGTTESQYWVQLWPNGPKFAVTAITGISNYNVGTDKAKSTWGPNWRDPSEAEILTMVSKCTISYANNQFKITGTNNKSITIDATTSDKTKLYLWTSFCATDNSDNTKRLALYIESSSNPNVNTIRIVPYSVVVGSGSILPVLNE